MPYHYRIGNSVAVDTEGRVVVGSSQGAIFMYSLQNTGRLEQTGNYIKSNTGFGLNVAASEGITVATAFKEDDYKGTLYIFENGQELKITPDDPMTGAHFGFSVAISGDTVVAGAPFHGTGAAYVFQKNITGNWEEVEKLFSNDAGMFGYDVAISENTILIGAPNNDPTGDDDNIVLLDNSSVFIYQKSKNNNTWALETKVAPSDVEYDDYFGQSVAISGNELVFGSPYDDNGRGSIYTYRED